MYFPLWNLFTEQLPLRRSFKYLSVSFPLFVSLTISLLLTASLNEPKSLGYVIYCLAKLFKKMLTKNFLCKINAKRRKKRFFSPKR